jgi:exosortase/archaeosortase family protein
MVGSLYAYLNYRSTPGEHCFMLVAIMVPIVANWVRAYMIVMIGYLSDNVGRGRGRSPLYGWLFFGVVILLMFWIGTLLARGRPMRHRMLAPLPCRRRRGADWQERFLHCLLPHCFPLMLQHMDETGGTLHGRTERARTSGAWTLPTDMIRSTATAPIYGTSRHGYQFYRHDSGRQVGLYVAYYARTARGGRTDLRGRTE